MLFSLLVALLPQVPSATAATPATVTVPRVDAEAVIDGRLSEPVWQQAARLGDFRQYEPVDGRPAEEQTEVLVWYAPDAIHFGVIARDRQPGSIRASRADRDNITGEDHVVIYLDTFNDRRRAFFFAVNPLGVQADGVRTEGASSAGRMFGSNTDYSPDFIFDSKGALTPEGYVIEVRVPFKSLRYPTNGPQRWGLQIERKTQRTGYTDTWTDVRRASASYLAQAGSMDGLRDLERGVVLEAQPFFTASANGALQEAGFERADPTGEVGVNAKMSFTNIAIDVTANPDFSQVESDAGQVTLNERFALFIPEKRPFFLEGIELFNTPNQLVYTRQVVAPLGGAKVTGKLGPIGVAHLTAVDEEVTPVCLGVCPAILPTRRNALFNITRLRRDFGSNSTAGLLVTDRSLLENDEYNRVVAADTRIVFKKLYYVEGQVGGSWSRDAYGNARSGRLWKLDADRTGRRWGFHYGINALDNEFDARAGFVPRVGIVTARAFNRLSFYGSPGALAQQFSIFAGPTYYWRYDDFPNSGALEGSESANLSLRLRGGWNLTGNIGRIFFNLDDYNHLQVQTPGGPQPYRALDEISGPSFQGSITTPTYRRFDANLTIGQSAAPLFAEGSEGSGWTAFGGVSVRPTTSIRIGWTGGVQHFERVRDGAEYARTVLSRWKVEYQPTRALFFRAIADSRDERQAALEAASTGEPLLLNGQPVSAFERRNLRIDLLVSYEPRPGTVAFFGYGAGLLEQPPLTSRLERMTDGFFVKLAYQFRR